MKKLINVVDNVVDEMLDGMTAAFPLIVYNGAFIKDNATGEMLLENFSISRTRWI